MYDLKCCQYHCVNVDKPTTPTLIAKVDNGSTHLSCSSYSRSLPLQMSPAFEYLWFVNNSSVLNNSDQFDGHEKLDTNTSQLSVDEHIAMDMMYWCVVQEVRSKYISDMSNPFIQNKQIHTQAESSHQNSSINCSGE